MSLTLKQGDNDFEKLEKGIYHATCFRMVDLGTQDNTYKGETNKKMKVQIDFEITEALDPDNIAPEETLKDSRLSNFSVIDFDNFEETDLSNQDKDLMEKIKLEEKLKINLVRQLYKIDEHYDIDELNGKFLVNIRSENMEQECSI